MIDRTKIIDRSTVNHKRRGDKRQPLAQELGHRADAKSIARNRAEPIAAALAGRVMRTGDDKS
jgi:hypothetical protein